MGNGINMGYICLQRQIMDWEWWTDHNTTRLWIVLLLLANYEDRNWRGIEIKRGQLLTSLRSLSQKSGLSVQSVRTAISHLKATGEITCHTTKTYTLITVENYGKYQISKGATNTADTKEPTRNLTNDQQRANTASTHTNKDNNYKELKRNNYYPIPRAKEDDDWMEMEI